MSPAYEGNDGDSGDGGGAAEGVEELIGATTPDYLLMTEVK